jgi:hypothetical protein
VTGKECPADLYFAPGRIVTMKSRRPDCPSVVRVDREQGASRFQRLTEEDSKWTLFVAMPVRVLLPNERIGRYGKQIVEVARLERPQFQELAPECGLEVESHNGIVGLDLKLRPVSASRPPLRSRPKPDPPQKAAYQQGYHSANLKVPRAFWRDTLQYS